MSDMIEQQPKLENFTETQADDDVKEGRDGGMWLGFVGGTIAAVVGAALWNGIAIATGHLIAEVAVLCGFLGGIGFGLSAKGDKTALGIMGSIFGSVSIVLGYYFIYLSPIQVGYISITPSSVMSFKEFWSVFVDPIDYLFILAGAGAGFGGARFVRRRSVV